MIPTMLHRDPISHLRWLYGAMSAVCLRGHSVAIVTCDGNSSWSRWVTHLKSLLWRPSGHKALRPSPVTDTVLLHSVTLLSHLNTIQPLRDLPRYSIHASNRSASLEQPDYWGASLRVLRDRAVESCYIALLVIWSASNH